MVINTFKRISIALYLCTCSVLGFATQITIVDSDNKPIEHVVISFTSAANNDFKTPTEVAIMDQVDSQFLPTTLVVSAGQWVDFPNSDNVRHHVYSFSNPKTFEIKLFSGSEADPIQFNKPGIVVLGCNIHDSMVGYIYVSDQNTTRISDAFGQLTISVNDLSGVTRKEGAPTLAKANLWHPLLSSSKTERIEIHVDTSKDEQTIQLNIKQSLVDEKKKRTGFSSRFKRTY